jgi:hypothetical protein
MLIGGHKKQGGVIRLWPEEYFIRGLAVGEGIETCLTLAHAYKPVWSCIDAGNLANFPVMSNMDALVIGVDHDEAGIKAATQLDKRYHEAGITTVFSFAPTSGQDLNDLVKGGV